VEDKHFMMLIIDAQGRIGSYVAGGGSSNDHYVKQQQEKVSKWAQMLKQ